MARRSAKVLGIRIVRIDTGQNGGFVTNVLLRSVLNWILSDIPFYAAIDILFILEKTSAASTTISPGPVSSRLPTICDAASTVVGITAIFGSMRHFRSKVDFIPVLLLVLAVFLLDTAAMGFAVPAMAHVDNLAPFALFLVAAFIPVLLVLAAFPVRYHMSSRELVVRSGLLRWTIPIASLHRASMDRGVQPAPALSMDRIRLDYQKGDRVRTLYVSPVEPLEFLACLVLRDKGLGFDGGDVVRHSGPILWFENAPAHAS